MPINARVKNKGSTDKPELVVDSQFCSSGVAPAQPPCPMPPELPFGYAYLLEVGPKLAARLLADKKADKEAADAEAQKAIDAEDAAANLRAEAARLWGEAADAWKKALDSGFGSDVRDAQRKDNRASAKDRQAASKEAEAAAHRRREADLRAKISRDP